MDRWDDRKGTAILKSFEHGHTEEKQEIVSTLASLTAAQPLGICAFREEVPRRVDVLEARR
jgi:hypothetical protein